MRETQIRWKRIVLAIVLAVCALVTPKARVNAEGINESSLAESYMAQGIRAAYHNMHLLYEAYYDEEGNLTSQAAGHVAIEQDWDGDVLVSRTYLDENCQPMNRIDGYSKAVWEEDESGTRCVVFYDKDGCKVDSTGLNLVRDVKVSSNGWSEWMSPDEDAPYTLFVVDEINLGEKNEGDAYTCQIEIEFRNVTGVEGKTCGFKTQGKTDDGWSVGNPWWIVAYWDSLPENTIYKFEKTTIIDQEMARASVFEIGFRCDNWASGSFRVRKIKSEKGHSATDWTPGL